MTVDIDKELEATYEEIIDVLSRRLKSIWDIVNSLQKSNQALTEKLGHIRESVVDLKTLAVTLPPEEKGAARLAEIVEGLEKVL